MVGGTPMTDLVHKVRDGHAELRREGRTAYRLPVTLFRGRDEIPLSADDVSFHGLFLETEETLPMRHLVRLRFLLPPYDRELVAHGMVVRVAPPSGEPGKRAGVGVELYGLDRAARTVWSNFVARVQAGDFRHDDLDLGQLGEIRFLEPDVVVDEES
jgi:hypothetical protein